MKLLVRGALLLGFVFVALVVGLAIYLPRFVQRDSVRVELSTLASQAIGTDVGFESLDVSLFPPSLIVLRPLVAGARPDLPRLFEAREVSLRIALLPLLARTVLIDSLVIEGAVVKLRRTEDGVAILPESEEAAAGETPGATLPGPRICSAGMVRPLLVDFQPSSVFFSTQS